MSLSFILSNQSKLFHSKRQFFQKFFLPKTWKKLQGLVGLWLEAEN